MSDDKTEEPSSQKIQKARDDGQVAKSAEFTGIVVMFVAGAASWFYGPTAAGQIMALFRRATDIVGRGPTPIEAVSFVSDAGLVLVMSISPVLVAAFAGAIFVNYVQVGSIFSLKAVMPDLNRLNPVEGIKNVISKRKVTDLVKNIAKLGLMAWVGTVLFMDALPNMGRLPSYDLHSSLGFASKVLFDLAVWLAFVLLAISIVDLVLQRRRHHKDLMMSKQEVKDEFKQSEGDQSMKSQRKRMHQQLAKGGGGAARVKNADAVVVNPTHVAIALMYDENTMEEPEIIARGLDEHARAIRRAAVKYGVPIVENVDLARALFQVDDDLGIPPTLFEAVAEVLQYVYSLRVED